MWKWKDLFYRSRPLYYKPRRNELLKRSMGINLFPTDNFQRSARRLLRNSTYWSNKQTKKSANNYMTQSTRHGIVNNRTKRPASGLKGKPCAQRRARKIATVNPLTEWTHVKANSFPCWMLEMGCFQPSSTCPLLAIQDEHVSFLYQERVFRFERVRCKDNTR